MNPENGRRVGVVIPTYNERENIAALVKGVLRAGRNVHVVVVDDNSPDGTGEAADELARGEPCSGAQRILQGEPRVIVVHRYTERGRGTAGRDGFLRCIAEGFDFIMEMDADFSHDPSEIPKLLAAARDADVVIGSRLVPGGQEAGRSLLRRLTTLAANFYLRHALGVARVRDCTSGFRCFRRQALVSADVRSVKSRGPSIVTEILFRCRKMRIVEVPIHFRARAAGRSKFNLKAIIEGLLVPPKLWWREILGR